MTIDRHGRAHQAAGTPQGGQFAPQRLPRARDFGYQQAWSLERIGTSGPYGVSADEALGLRGKAANYSGRYMDALRSAIAAHNDFTCPENCPLEHRGDRDLLTKEQVLPYVDQGR